MLAAGYTFGTVRGGGVVAWDNNETRGTLGIRALRGSHQNTTRELLDDLDKFTGAEARIGDLASYVRTQGDAHFDVLASDERPGVTGTIRAQDFDDVHRLLERFYRLVLVDTGNNMRAENWLAAAEAADLLVVTSTVREDTGYSGLWMLDALAGRRVPQPQVQDGHGAVRPLRPGGRRPGPRPGRGLRPAHPRRASGAVRPGAGGGVGAAVPRPLQGDPPCLAHGVRGASGSRPPSEACLAD